MSEKELMDFLTANVETINKAASEGNALANELCAEAQWVRFGLAVIGGFMEVDTTRLQNLCVRWLHESAAHR